MVQTSLVYHIEFIRSGLSNFSAHATGVCICRSVSLSVSVARHTRHDCSDFTDTSYGETLRPAGRPGDWPGDPMASTRIFAGFVLGVRPIGATGGRAAALGAAGARTRGQAAAASTAITNKNTTQHTHTTPAGGAPTRRLRNETRRMRSNNCTVTRYADTGRKPAAPERSRPPARLPTRGRVEHGTCPARPARGLAGFD